MIGLVLAGFLTGALVGLTGIGGGLLMTPFLLYLGVPPTVAVGSDLVYGAVTKLVGAWRHARGARVRWDWVWGAALAAVPASWMGTALVYRLHLDGAAGQELLRHLVGGVLVLASLGVGVAEWRRLRSPDPQARRGTMAGEGEAMPPGRRGALVAAGGLTGLLVGLTSIGGGSLYAAVLLLASRLSPREIVGTDLAFGAVLAGAAALGHGVAGTVDYRLVGPLLAGSLPGVLLGSRLAGAAPPRALRLGLAACILVSGLRLVAV